MKIISSYEYTTLKQDQKKLKEALNRVEYLEENEKRIQDRIKDLERENSSFAKEYELREKQAVAAMTDKHNKQLNELEKKHNKELAELQAKVSQETQKKLESMMEDNYRKLSDSMTKLHEEGNAQTKFMQETTQSLIQATSTLAVANNTTKNESILTYKENKGEVQQG